MNDTEVPCPYCGRVNKSKIWHRISGGFDVCNRCFGTDFTKCNECQMSVHRDDAKKSTNGKFYCRECAK